MTRRRSTANGREATADARLFDRSTRQTFAIGAGIALAVTLIPFVRFIFSYFTILFHELGHAAVGTLFGYPSIPAFDLQYGGGVTIHQDRSMLIVVLVVIALAYACKHFHEYRHLQMVLVVTTAAYAVFAFLPLHEAAMIAAGHLGELLLAGVFLYRAATASGVKTPAERPLYAAIGLFVILCDLTFAWGLMSSREERAMYGDAKGGGHWMDFSQLSELGGISLSSVAFLFALVVLATPVLALLIARNRSAIGRWVAE